MSEMNSGDTWPEGNSANWIPILALAIGLLMCIGVCVCLQQMKKRRRKERRKHKQLNATAVYDKSTSNKSKSTTPPPPLRQTLKMKFNKKKDKSSLDAGGKGGSQDVDNRGALMPQVLSKSHRTESATIPSSEVTAKTNPSTSHQTAGSKRSRKEHPKSSKSRKSSNV